MGRPRGFDADQARERALQQFWTHGYNATSIDQLVTALGVNRASLYATFGGKRELYQAALESYRAQLLSALLPTLAGGGPALDALGRFFDALVEYVSDGKRRGCLLTQTMLELGPRDRRARNFVVEYLTTLEDALLEVLARAKQQGELGAAAQPRALARFLVGVAQGVIVLSKGQADAKSLRDVTRSAIAGLR
jgi:TetR/AcrR family transcriptional repressor of nem operon